MNRSLKENILYHIIYWNVSCILFGLLHFTAFDLSSSFLDLIPYLPLPLFVGTLSGSVYGTANFYFTHRIYQRRSFGQAIFLGTVIFGFIAVFSCSVAIKTYYLFAGVPINVQSVSGLFSSTGGIIFIFYLFLMSGMADYIDQVSFRLGPGNLWKLLKAEYYEPKQEERVFMFVDLRSSTTLAEKLGHIKYTRLIQDCFSELSVVSKHRAEIYQYVGDEVVLTWTAKNGIENSDCINTVLDFFKRLEDKRDYFLSTYDCFPEFKAGAHIGIVTAAEIGEVKRDIQYFGDTINTASRIQNRCNEFNCDLLCSQELYDQLLPDGKELLKEVAEVLLKGKAKPVKLFGLK